MGAIMEFATEKQIESFLSTCHIEGQKNFLMAFKKKTWLKSFIDFDDQNGNVDISNVSINSNTVVQNYNTFDLDKKLEAKGLKVENVKLRHSKFWGSGLPCETVVLEREPN